MTYFVWLICHIVYDEMNELWNACKMHWTASPVFIIARDIMCHMISRDFTWCHVNRCILQKLWHWANTNGGFWLVPWNGSSRKIFEIIQTGFRRFSSPRSLLVQTGSQISPDLSLIWFILGPVHSRAGPNSHFLNRTSSESKYLVLYLRPVLFLDRWNWSWHGPVRIWWKLVWPG